jgi:hypothetical protein
MRGFRTTIVPYDARAPTVVTEFSRTSTNEGVAGGRGFADLSPCVSGRQ